MHAKSPQSCLTLCNPMDVSPPSSSLYGILQARILERAAMPSNRESFQPGDRTRISYISCIGKWVLTTSATWEAPFTAHISNISRGRERGTFPADSTNPWFESVDLILGRALNQSHDQGDRLARLAWPWLSRPQSCACTWGVTSVISTYTMCAE